MRTAQAREYHRNRKLRDVKIRVPHHACQKKQDFSKKAVGPHLTVVPTPPLNQALERM